MKAVHTLIAAFLILCSACSVAQAQDAANKVSITFVGDIMLDDTPGKVVRSGRDPFQFTSAAVNGADIRVGNLECAVATLGTPEPDKPYTFRANPRTLTYVKKHFDAVALANNHSGDYGPEAFGEMLGLLKQNNIGYFGGGHTLAEAHVPLIIERNGLRIAFLGYNEYFPRSYEADVDKPGIAWSEDEQVRYDIAAARSVYHADLVIPMMHWGWENKRAGSKRQRELARLMIDAGADAVVGGHPHVTQDVEQYQGKPIIYSLGNFLFDGFSKDEEHIGWILTMEVDRSGALDWKTVPAHIDREGVPHLQSSDAPTCWKRGQNLAGPC